MGTSDLADTAGTVNEASPFTYSPWKMKDIRRLYVTHCDSGQLGYLDLATLTVVAEDAATQDLLQEALNLLGTRQRLGPTSSPIDCRATATLMTWHDLAANVPGQSISDLDDPSFRAGVAGEQRTAGVLTRLEKQGYKVLHSIPLTPRKDIDHLVIGPTGLYAINTKATTYDVTAKADGSVYADGYRQKWIESIARDAAVAAEHLSSAARMDLVINPLVTVWSTMRVTSGTGHLLLGDDLIGALTGPSPVFPSEWVDVLYNVARRSDTWTAHH